MHSLSHVWYALMLCTLLLLLYHSPNLTPQGPLHTHTIICNQSFRPPKSYSNGRRRSLSQVAMDISLLNSGNRLKGLNYVEVKVKISTPSYSCPNCKLTSKFKFSPSSGGELLYDILYGILAARATECCFVAQWCDDVKRLGVKCSKASIRVFVRLIAIMSI